MGLEDSLTDDLIYKRLLQYGFFPEKLELLLTSEKFGEWVLASDYNNYSNKCFSNITFRLTRNNNAPRLLNILHPLGYIHLCKEIRNNWELIKAKINEVPNYEKISMIIPKSDNINERIVSMGDYERLVSLKFCNTNKEEKFIITNKQLGKKYYVHADIANCFPTVYSHAIPWACVGHLDAKRTKGDNDIWYNRLDCKSRATQRNETIGIAIGPDSSNIICELILSQIDKDLSDYDYIRFIDDYKCFCSTKEEADKFIRELSFLLEKYHFRLNSKKTKITLLPHPIEDIWVRKIREYNNVHLSNNDDITQKDILRINDFIDLTIDLVNKYPDESSLKYAVRILANKNYVDYEIFSYILSSLSHICFLYPYFIDVIYDLLEKNNGRIDEKIRTQLQEAINIIFKEHIKNNLSDVIVWCIKIAIKYNLELSDFEYLSGEIRSNRDCLPFLFCFLYSKNRGFDLRIYFDFVLTIKSENLEDEWWLYIYEVFRMYSTKPVFSGIQWKDFYTLLRDANITFLR